MTAKTIDANGRPLTNVVTDPNTVVDLQPAVTEKIAELEAHIAQMDKQDEEARKRFGPDPKLAKTDSGKVATSK